MTGRRFDFALKDALASSRGNVLNDKAFHCAGRSAYELGHYADSKGHFEKALELNPRDTKYLKELNRAKVRESPDRTTAFTIC